MTDDEIEQALKYQHDVGFEVGYEEGYEFGYDSAFNDGYQAGIDSVDLNEVNNE